jgi:hypothetical protein
LPVSGFLFLVGSWFIDYRFFKIFFFIFKFRIPMAYFPNAFKKVFRADTLVTTGGTEDLTAGQFGFFDAKTWEAVPVVEATAADHPNVVLVSGSYHTADKFGTHGGYKESIKSQVINPYHINRVWKVLGRSAQQQIVRLGWNGSDADTAPVFKCGQNYHLRVDLKGSPTLRFLGHNLYHTFDVFTGCCTNVDTPESVDPVSVLLDFAEQINGDPFFSQFVSASVVDGSGTVDPDTYTVLTDSGDIDDATGALILTVAYVDTSFGRCSFDPVDHFELEPVIISSAQLMDESGDPCSGFKQLTFTETQAPLTAEGTGEQVIRDLILFHNYRQEPYFTDPRRREVEGADFVSSAVTRTGIYDSYYILHSVPRKYNPTGVYNNDQYLLQINVIENTDMSNFENWITSYTESVNTGVTMENFSESESS